MFLRNWKTNSKIQWVTSWLLLVPTLTFTTSQDRDWSPPGRKNSKELNLSLDFHILPLSPLLISFSLSLPICGTVGWTTLPSAHHSEGSLSSRTTCLFSFPTIKSFVWTIHHSLFWKKQSGSLLPRITWYNCFLLSGRSWYPMNQTKDKWTKDHKREDHFRVDGLVSLFLSAIDQTRFC